VDTGPDPIYSPPPTRGDLDTQAGLNRQADRLWIRAADGRSARFFLDMLELDNLDNLSKDQRSILIHLRVARELGSRRCDDHRASG